jgi:hypothetical protein
MPGTIHAEKHFTASESVREVVRCGSGVRHRAMDRVAEEAHRGNPRLLRGSVPNSMIEYVHLDLRKEADMAIQKTIRTKIGRVEGQLARRVSSLEKDVARLMKRLEKKEHEVKILKDKLTSGLAKKVMKKVKKAKKAVRKRLPGIG